MAMLLCNLLSRFSEAFLRGVCAETRLPTVMSVEVRIQLYNWYTCTSCRSWETQHVAFQSVSITSGGYGEGIVCIA